MVLEGEVDLAQKNELTAAVAEIQAAGHRRVIVDFTACTFVDSTALNAIVNLAETCDVTVVGASEQLRRLLTLIGLSDLLHLED